MATVSGYNREETSNVELGELTENANCFMYVQNIATSEIDPMLRLRWIGLHQILSCWILNLGSNGGTRNLIVDGPDENVSDNNLNHFVEHLW